MHVMFKRSYVAVSMALVVGCPVCLAGETPIADKNQVSQPAAKAGSGKIDAAPANADGNSGAKAKDIVLAPANGSGQPIAITAQSAALGAPAADAVGTGVDAGQVTFGSNLANLGLHLLRSQTSETGTAQSNAMTSPFGVANALGMLHAGAVGPTAREIARLFESSGASGKLLRKQMKSANASLGRAVEGVELVTANRVWLDQSIVPEVSPVFSASVAEIYRGDGVAISLANADAAAKAINKWASDSTRGKISQLIAPSALPASAKAVVTNAVYFKGKWKTPFDANATQKMPFFVKPDQSVDVPTMNGTIALRMGQMEGLQIYELPYGNGDFVMLIALPIDKRHTLNALEQDIDGSDIAHWSQALQPATVQLQLPKFRIDPVAKSIKSALIADDMKSAFSAAADFSGMVGKTQLMVDDILHAAGVIVDEQGTEASAATAAIMRSKSLGMDFPQLHKINRPFMFVLAHKRSAMPLFIGRIAKPE